MKAPDPEESIRRAAEIIRQHQDFALTSHVNSDGDGIGSELAFALALRALGKRAAIFNPGPTPENYRWLDPGGEIIRFSPERDRERILETGAIVILDTNHPGRLGELEQPVRQARGVKIVIDHHL